MGLISERDALARRERRDGRGEGVHAALDKPHARALDMGDEHQRRRREERRRAAIGGVAAEQLHQARIAEVFAERRPEDVEWADLT